MESSFKKSESVAIEILPPIKRRIAPTFSGSSTDEAGGRATILGVRLEELTLRFANVERSIAFYGDEPVHTTPMHPPHLRGIRRLRPGPDTVHIAAVRVPSPVSRLECLTPEVQTKHRPRYLRPMTCYIIAHEAHTRRPCRFFPRRTQMYGSKMNYSVTINVPQLDEGLRFYRGALGLAEVARPVATYVILKCGNGQIGLIEKRAGSKPAKGSDDVRRYERHWTPVHIDFHVDDFESVLINVLNAGGKREQKFEGGQRPPIAFCSDPFGNGFCIIGKKAEA
jgi:catechol 2,3-dioxygenase-like lactoylglutathione lyase family enzyme